MIHVIAVIEVATGKRQDFLAAFRELVPLVRAEVGCIEYGPAIDVATPIERQEPVRENAVTVVERWESVESLQDHLRAPHMDRHREQVKEMVTGIKIQILEPA